MLELIQLADIDACGGLLPIVKVIRNGLFPIVPMFIEALFTTAQTWKKPKCPLTEEWIKTICHIYTMEHFSAIKKRKLRLSATTKAETLLCRLRSV